MRILCLTLALALPAAAAAQQTPKVQGANEATVTGLRLSDSERALQECIARKCPVDQDVAATLRHAENQFVAGKYTDARRTLGAGRGRTRRFAKEYPVPVSNLLRAMAVVASHLGEGEAYEFASIDSLVALKTGLPADDPQVLTARIEVADAYNRLGRFDAAEDLYRSVAKRAHELDLPNVAGLAEFHLASMFTAYAKTEPGIYAAGAVKAIDTLLAYTDPRYAQFVAAARVLKARQQLRGGDPKAVDAVIAELRAAPPTDRPVLVYAPLIESIRSSSRGAYQTINNELGGATRTALSSLALRNYDDQWVDVGFYVTPEGQVADAAVLRQSAKLESDDWVKPILSAISGRRYLPLKRARTDPGILRVERYTLTALIEDKPGTRIRGHAPAPRIEVLDLSVDPVPPEPKRGSI